MTAAGSMAGARPYSVPGWNTWPPTPWFTTSSPSSAASSVGHASAGSSTTKPCAMESPSTRRLRRFSTGSMKLPLPTTERSVQPRRHGSHTRTWCVSPMPGSCMTPSAGAAEGSSSVNVTWSSAGAGTRTPSGRPSTSHERPSCMRADAAAPACRAKASRAVPCRPASRASTYFRTSRVPTGSPSRRTSSATSEESVVNSRQTPAVARPICR